MNDRQRQTEFLRQCLPYDENNERHELAERIRHVQRNERSVRRAVWFMVLVAALALAGLACLAIFLPGFPENTPGLITRLMTKLFGPLGLGSLICIPAFVGLEVVYRKELNARREECRRLATSLLESRLGKPGALNGTKPETFGRNSVGESGWSATSPPHNRRDNNQTIIIKIESIIMRTRFTNPGPLSSGGNSVRGAKSSKIRFVSGIALLAALTGCVGYVEGPPRAGAYAPPEAVYGESGIAAQDDYVYYPGYQVYYSNNRRQYVYQEGRSWVSRSAPPHVTTEVLVASPSVSMDFHDSPAIHHRAVVQQYPKNWAPPGQRLSNKGDEHDMQ